MSHTTEKPSKIKVGMILDINFPPDDRPEKEALSLIEAGYEVYLLCVSTSDKPLRENYKGIHITRIKFNSYIRKKLSSAYLVLPFYRWIWREHLRSFIRENKINILHVHDLPLSDIAIEFGKELNLKIVCDQHEYWSNWIGTTAHYNTFLGKIVKRLSNWKEYERKYLRQADLIITVTEPLRKAYIERVGIEPKRILTIPNTPSGRYFNPQNIDENIIDQYRDKFVIIYAGVMSITRGLEYIIKSLKELEESIPNILFLLAGRSSRKCDPLLMAQQERVTHLIDFVGWIPVEKLSSYIAAANIGVFTPTNLDNDEINKTIATKVYQYAAMHLPIIVSKVKMMREFVEDNELGFAVDVDDNNDFINAVKKIHSDYKKIKSRVTQNSQELFKSTPIFWEDSIKPMLDFYEKMRAQLRNF